MPNGLIALRPISGRLTGLVRFLNRTARFSVRGSGRARAHIVYTDGGVDSAVLQRNALGGEALLPLAAKHTAGAAVSANGEVALVGAAGGASVSFVLECVKAHLLAEREKAAAVDFSTKQAAADAREETAAQHSHEETAEEISEKADAHERPEAARENDGAKAEHALNGALKIAIEKPQTEAELMGAIAPPAIPTQALAPRTAVSYGEKDAMEDFASRMTQKTYTEADAAMDAAERMVKRASEQPAPVISQCAVITEPISVKTVENAEPAAKAAPCDEADANVASPNDGASGGEASVRDECEKCAAPSYEREAEIVRAAFLTDSKPYVDDAEDDFLPPLSNRMRVEFGKMLGIFHNAFPRDYPRVNWQVYSRPGGSHLLRTKMGDRELFAIPSPPSALPPPGLPATAKYATSRQRQGYFVF